LFALTDEFGFSRPDAGWEAFCMNAMKSLSGGAFQPVKTPFDGCNGNGEVSTSAHPASLLPAARKTEQIAAWFDGDEA
jgi:hypothetical protein